MFNYITIEDVQTLYNFNLDADQQKYQDAYLQFASERANYLSGNRIEITGFDNLNDVQQELVKRATARYLVWLLQNGQTWAVGAVSVSTQGISLSQSAPPEPQYIIDIVGGLLQQAQLYFPRIFVKDDTLTYNARQDNTFNDTFWSSSDYPVSVSFAYANFISYTNFTSSDDSVTITSSLDNNVRKLDLKAQGGGNIPDNVLTEDNTTPFPIEITEALTVGLDNSDKLVVDIGTISENIQANADGIFTLNSSTPEGALKRSGLGTDNSNYTPHALVETEGGKYIVKVNTSGGGTPGGVAWNLLPDSNRSYVTQGVVFDVSNIDITNFTIIGNVVLVDPNNEISVKTVSPLSLGQRANAFDIQTATANKLNFQCTDMCSTSGVDPDLNNGSVSLSYNYVSSDPTSRSLTVHFTYQPGGTRWNVDSTHAGNTLKLVYANPIDVGGDARFSDGTQLSTVAYADVQNTMTAFSDGVLVSALDSSTFLSGSNLNDGEIPLNGTDTPLILGEYDSVDNMLFVRLPWTVTSGDPNTAIGLRPIYPSSTGQLFTDLGFNPFAPQSSGNVTVYIHPDPDNSHFLRADFSALTSTVATAENLPITATDNNGVVTFGVSSGYDTIRTNVIDNSNAISVFNGNSSGGVLKREMLTELTGNEAIRYVGLDNDKLAIRLDETSGGVSSLSSTDTTLPIVLSASTGGITLTSASSYSTALTDIVNIQTQIDTYNGTTDGGVLTRGDLTELTGNETIRKVGFDPDGDLAIRLNTGDGTSGVTSIDVSQATMLQINQSTGAVVLGSSSEYSNLLTDALRVTQNVDVQPLTDVANYIRVVYNDNSADPELGLYQKLYVETPNVFSKIESSVDGRVRFIANEAYVQGFVDSSYVEGIITETYIKGFVNPAYVLGLVDPYFQGNSNTGNKYFVNIDDSNFAFVNVPATNAPDIIITNEAQSLIEITASGTNQHSLSVANSTFGTNLISVINELVGDTEQGAVRYNSFQPIERAFNPDTDIEIVHTTGANRQFFAPDAISSNEPQYSTFQNRNATSATQFAFRPILDENDNYAIGVEQSAFRSALIRDRVYNNINWYPLHWDLTGGSENIMDRDWQNSTTQDPTALNLLKAFNLSINPDLTPPNFDADTFWDLLGNSVLYQNTTINAFDLLRNTSIKVQLNKLWNAPGTSPEHNNGVTFSGDLKFGSAYWFEDSTSAHYGDLQGFSFEGQMPYSGVGTNAQDPKFIRGTFLFYVVYDADDNALYSAYFRAHLENFTTTDISNFITGNEMHFAYFYNGLTQNRLIDLGE